MNGRVAVTFECFCYRDLLLGIKVRRDHRNAEGMQICDHAAENALCIGAAQSFRREFIQQDQVKGKLTQLERGAEFVSDLADGDLNAELTKLIQPYLHHLDILEKDIRGDLHADRGGQRIRIQRERAVKNADQRTVDDKLRDRGDDEILHAVIPLHQSRDQANDPLEVALHDLLALRRSAGDEAILVEGQRAELQTVEHHEGSGKVNVLLVKRDVAVIERNRLNAAFHGIVDHLLNCYL